MPGYIDELLRMLGQAQVPPGVTRSMAPPSMSGMDMEGEALRQALAGLNSNALPDINMASTDWSELNPVADFIPNELASPQRAPDFKLKAGWPGGGRFEEPFQVIPDIPNPREAWDAEMRRMVQMSQQRAPFYDAAPYEQVLGPNASRTTGVPVPVTRDNPMAYGNSMQSVMPAQEMEPANMDIRSLLAALAGAGGGFAAGRMTAPPQMSVADLTHTMPDGTVMPGSEEDMYREAAASMQEDPNASSAMMMRFPMDAYEAMPPIPDGERVPGSMRIPMPPPYKTPPQLQKLNNLRMP